MKSRLKKRSPRGLCGPDLVRAGVVALIICIGLIARGSRPSAIAMMVSLFDINARMNTTWRQFGASHLTIRRDGQNG